PLREGAADRELVDLRGVVQDTLAIFGHRFRSAGVAVSVTDDGFPAISATHGHAMQIVLALLDNAAYWLRHHDGDAPPAVRIHLWARGKSGGLIVADNGPGISPALARAIFEPFYTTRREGLGLGLFIVRMLLERYDGRIDVLDDDRLLPGANLRVRFRLADATGGADR
ncbi:MAG TPA: HAMP domain-containing sensor histidine kinase, partial [Acidimicrobiales bacterium]|nr:HAMP domain-containing sensor histidine kinase [Acidimicrobiales bacterium]